MTLSLGLKKGANKLYSLHRLNTIEGFRWTRVV